MRPFYFLNLVLCVGCLCAASPLVLRSIITSEIVSNNTTLVTKTSGFYNAKCPEGTVFMVIESYVEDEDIEGVISTAVEGDISFRVFHIEGPTGRSERNSPFGIPLIAPQNTIVEVTLTPTDCDAVLEATDKMRYTTFEMNYIVYPNNQTDDQRENLIVSGEITNSTTTNATTTSTGSNITTTVTNDTSTTVATTTTTVTTTVTTTTVTTTTSTTTITQSTTSCPHTASKLLDGDDAHPGSNFWFMPAVTRDDTIEMLDDVCGICNLDEIGEDNGTGDEEDEEEEQDGDAVHDKSWSFEDYAALREESWLLPPTTADEVRESLVGYYETFYETDYNYGRFRDEWDGWEQEVEEDGLKCVKYTIHRHVKNVQLSVMDEVMHVVAGAVSIICLVSFFVFGSVIVVSYLW